MCVCVAAGATGALLSYGTTQLLADRTMASAIGNASGRITAAGTCWPPYTMCCLASEEQALPAQCCEHCSTSSVADVAEHDLYSSACQCSTY